MSTPEVREATEADLRALGTLLAPLPLFTAYGLSAEALAARWIAGLQRKEGLLTATVDGAHQGICWFLHDGTFATGAYLRTLAVVPGGHGKGIGARLLEAFERAGPVPAGGWFLLASDFNAGAHRFYQRHGYGEVGQLPGFGKDGIVERVFWKPPRKGA